MKAVTVTWFVSHLAWTASLHLSHSLKAIALEFPAIGMLSPNYPSLLLLCYLNIVHFLALGVYTIIRVGHGFSVF
jgi:hypothetical protein